MGQKYRFLTKTFCMKMVFSWRNTHFHYTVYHKICQKILKFHRNIETFLAMFGQKFVLLAHSGGKIICPKLHFSLFSVTMDQKHVKLWFKFYRKRSIYYKSYEKLPLWAILSKNAPAILFKITLFLPRRGL